MITYRFSPIKNKEELFKAIEHVHFECYKLCKQTFGHYLQNAGNIGIFCHYDEEYDRVTKLRQEMTESTDNWNQKYFRLHKRIVIPAQGRVPETTYTYLYIRKPDPNHSHVGDADFYLEPKKYKKLKESLLAGKKIIGAGVFERPDLDLIRLSDPNSDVSAFVGSKTMAENVNASSQT